MMVEIAGEIFCCRCSITRVKISRKAQWLRRISSLKTSMAVNMAKVVVMVNADELKL